jgi:hypothetical protein
MKTLCAATFATCAMAALASSAGAAPAMNNGQAVLDESLLTPVARYVCTRDDRGWHYMRGDRRIVCRPARPRGSYWIWRSEGGRTGWWHRRENRWYD